MLANATKMARTMFFSLRRHGIGPSNAKRDLLVRFVFALCFPRECSQVKASHWQVNILAEYSHQFDRQKVRQVYIKHTKLTSLLIGCKDNAFLQQPVGTALWYWSWFWFEKRLCAKWGKTPSTYGAFFSALFAPRLPMLIFTSPLLLNMVRLYSAIAQ